MSHTVDMWILYVLLAGLVKRVLLVLLSSWFLLAVYLSLVKVSKDRKLLGICIPDNNLRKSKRESTYLN